KFVYGRGVGDRYVDTAENINLGGPTIENYYRTIGRWFLSAPLDEQDGLYLQLIKEFKQLATNPDFPFIPSMSRDDSEQEWDNRLIAYNRKDVEPLALGDNERQSLVFTILNEKQSIHTASKKEAEIKRTQTKQRRK